MTLAKYGTPVGDSIRKFINEALEDKRRRQIQLDELSKDLKLITLHFPALLKKAFNEVYIADAFLPPDEQNPFAIRQLTNVDPKTKQLAYNPVLEWHLTVRTDFTDFSPEDIKELPDYIALHEAARAENVAIKLEYLTTDQAQKGRVPTLTIDASKTYDEGSLENMNLYPVLSEPHEKEVASQTSPGFDRSKGRRFTFV